MDLKKIKVIFNPSKEHLKQVKEWLFYKKIKKEFGFHNNWNMIKKTFENNNFIVITYQNITSGFLTFHYINDGKKIIEIDIIEVADKYKKKGLGTILFKESEKYLLRKGVVVLDISHPLEQSINFWKKMGFMEYPNQIKREGYSIYKIIKIFKEIGQKLESENLETVEIFCNDHCFPKKERIIFSVNLKNNSRILELPIILPVHYDWTILWKKGNDVIEKKKVRYFQGGKYLIDRKILFIDKLPNIKVN